MHTQFHIQKSYLRSVAVFKGGDEYKTAVSSVDIGEPFYHH